MHVQLGIVDAEKDFIKSLGIKDVSINCIDVGKFDAYGHVNAKELMVAKEQLNDQGFSLRGLDLHSWNWLDEVAGQKIVQKEVNNLCRTIAAMGKAKVKTLIMPCSRKSLTSLSSSERKEFEKRVILVYRQLSKAAEQCGVKLASHTTFLPDIMVHNPESLDRFLKEVDSQANGILLCIGCISLAGICVEDMIDRYRDIIYAVHVRNVTGNWKNFKETRFDAGQIKIARVLHHLAKLGYKGGLIPEHCPKINNDQRTTMSWAAAYLKGICDSLETL